MVKKRGPDGVPIDVPTTVRRDDETVPNRPAPDSPTEPMNPPSPGGSSLFLDDPPTAPPKRSASEPIGGDATVERPAPTPPVPPSNNDEPATVLAGGKKSYSHEPIVEPLGQQNAMADPVVGWLVVINGPGKGQFVKLGLGQNSLGRGATERVALDFGDSQISRNNHATITYDPRGNRFYIQQGSGTNLAYVNDAPVLSPVILEPFSQIILGQTTLRFVPFCDQEFTWDER